MSAVLQTPTQSLFLSPGAHGDVADMTGAHTKTGQIRVLQQNGVAHIINAGGWPVVAVAVAEGRSKAAAPVTEWRSQAAPYAPARRRKSA